MGYSKAIIATACVAALPFGVAADRVEASTVSGSFVVELGGTMNRTFEFDEFERSAGTDTLVLEGGFQTTNSFVNPTGSAPLGWGIDVDLSWGGTNTDALRETDPANFGWGGVGGLFMKYNDQDPASALVSLFSLASFMNAIIGQSLNTPSPNVGSGTWLMANIPVAWEITEMSRDNTSPIEFSGDYTFTISGASNTAAFFDLFDGFAGLADIGGPGPAVLAQAPQFPQEFTLRATVSPIPVPAALPLMVGGLGMLGLMGWHRRRRTTA